ncbi:hypothetical protein PNA2_0774 [Pyrococcus sp. NA2]|uniref:DUF92 domain-containing protein n=1 Tax=Pyrococcus sp. (strain NA2) TaxID=342949 RepID=UPI000209AE87|nr:TIGR00297 family protein [Pyrococcus sp. NA2]AEC51690.1 hypothetical protein PNA2_0774 [Pyrococcus sp. NA2]
MEYIAFAIIPILGYGAYRAKALDLKGTISAIILGYLILLFGGGLPFLALLTFLIMGTIATRVGWKRKVSLGVHEDSCRSVGNVLGNGLAPLIFSLLEFIIRKDWGFAAIFSAISTANADTLASEIGKAFGGNPVLITNFRRAKIGEEGGITLIGELAALVGALIIGILSSFTSAHKLQMLLAVTLAGFLGSNVDSLIGATLEKKGYIDNNATNFIATLIGGLLGIIIFMLLL